MGCAMGEAFMSGRMVTAMKVSLSKIACRVKARIPGAMVEPTLVLSCASRREGQGLMRWPNGDRLRG